jgi:acetyl esterase/lipase
LTALLSTYTAKIDGEGIDEVDGESFLPNGQILCYPVISSDERISHQGSYRNLLGENYGERASFSPELLVNSTTPPAFIWHTADDGTVNVINSYRYAEALRNYSIPCELHIFPNGTHGLGLAEQNTYVTRWKDWLLTWLRG